jgi:hypothetical protein
MIFDLMQELPYFAGRSALDGATCRHNPPFDLGLESSRGGRHPRALFASRLRIAELRINSRHVSVLHLGGPVARQDDVQMLTDVPERLLGQLRLATQPGAACSLRVGHQPFVVRVPLPRDLGQK